MSIFAQNTDPPSWLVIAFFAVLLVTAFFVRRDACFADKLLKSDVAARGLGLFSLLMGIFAIYMILYSPISDALARRQMIVVPRGAVAICALFVLVGLGLLIAGRRAERLLVTRTPSGQHVTTVQWINTITLVAASIVVEVAVHRVFVALGYTPGLK